MNITTRDMTEFYSVITMELGNQYVNYANKYISNKKALGKPQPIYDRERNEIIVEAIISTASFYLKQKKVEDKNKLERYFYTTIANQIKRKSHPKSSLINFIDDYYDEQLNFPEELEEESTKMSDKLTMNEIDNWLKERLRQGKIVPIDYSIFRVRHILGRTVIEIAEKLGYSKSFVRLRCNNIKNYIKEELKYEFND